MVRQCLYRIILLPLQYQELSHWEHNNEELRNTNGCYLVTQISSNPNSRLTQIALDRNRRVIREYAFLFHSASSLFRHLAAVRVSP